MYRFEKAVGSLHQSDENIDHKDLDNLLVTSFVKANDHFYLIGRLYNKTTQSIYQHVFKLDDLFGEPESVEFEIEYRQYPFYSQGFFYFNRLTFQKNENPLRSNDNIVGQRGPVLTSQHAVFVSIPKVQMNILRKCKNKPITMRNRTP